MLLRFLAVLAFVISCTFPVAAKVSVVEPCPSKLVLDVCTLEAAFEATAPRVVVEGGACAIKCLGVSSVDISYVRLERSAAFPIQDSASMMGLSSDGIDRPPKGISI